MSGPIARAWSSYRTLVVPADAGEVQVEETRRAFYAGAAVIFQGLKIWLDGEDGTDEPSEADLAKMSEIQAEIDAFGLEIDLALLARGRVQ